MQKSAGFPILETFSIIKLGLFFKSTFRRVGPGLPPLILILEQVLHLFRKVMAQISILFPFRPTVFKFDGF